jgi:hypothetical protein
MRRIRPCASRAVEAVGPVHREQGVRSLHDAMLCSRSVRAVARRLPPGRALIGLEHGGTCGSLTRTPDLPTEEDGGRSDMVV